MNNLGQLPQELVSLIVRFALHPTYPNKKDLSNFALINKSFNLVTRPLLWRTCDIDSFAKYKKLFSLLEKSHQQQQRQQQQESEHISLGHCIHHVTIRYRLADSRLLELANYLGPQLKSLILLRSDNLTNISICPVLRQSPQLCCFKIMYNKNMTNESIQTLVQHCPHLNQLELVDCRKLTYDVFKILADCSFSSFVFNNYRVSGVLKKFGSGLELTSTQRTNFNLIIRILRDGHGDGGKPVLWPGLTRLKIVGSCGANDATIIPFIKSHPRLTDIILIRCSLTDTTLDTMTSTLPGVLTRLLVTGNPSLTAHAIRRLILACPLLTGLSLKGTGIRSSSFPELTQLSLRLPDYLDQLKLDTIRQHDSHQLNNNNNNGTEL